MSEANIPVFSEEDIQKNKTIAALCTIPALFWLCFVTGQDSAYVKFYANQGLILLILGVVSGILSAIPVIGWMISTVASLFIFVAWILALTSAIQGKTKPMLVIGTQLTLLR